MAVLINAETECCGELFACDLRDFGVASLIGEKTAGNASVQESFALSDGGGVILTVAKVKPYITETFENVGLQPNLAVSNTENDTDAQLKAATDFLAKE